MQKLQKLWFIILLLSLSIASSFATDKGNSKASGLDAGDSKSNSSGAVAPADTELGVVKLMAQFAMNSPWAKILWKEHHRQINKTIKDTPKYQEERLTSEKAAREYWQKLGKRLYECGKTVDCCPTTYKDGYVWFQKLGTFCLDEDKAKLAVYAHKNKESRFYDVTQPSLWYDKTIDSILRITFPPSSPLPEELFPEDYVQFQKLYRGYRKNS